MIAAAAMYYRRKDEAEVVRMGALDWTLTVTAAVIIFFSFALNHRVVYGGGIPASFNWWVFAAGMGLGVFVLMRVWLRLVSARR
jgi:hypothetical protein